jgi:hypothetical protein
MKVKDFDDKKLVNNLDILLQEFENRIINKMYEMNKSDGISDSDLKFLTDILSFTRSYNNLVHDPIFVGEPTKEDEHS